MGRWILKLLQVFVKTSRFEPSLLFEPPSKCCQSWLMCHNLFFRGACITWLMTHTMIHTLPHFSTEHWLLPTPPPPTEIYQSFLLRWQSLPVGSFTCLGGDKTPIHCSLFNCGFSFLRNTPRPPYSNTR